MKEKKFKKIIITGQSNTMPDGTINSTGQECVIEWDVTPTEVLKTLKIKIDAAGLNKCNYVIETSDIEAINQALSKKVE